MVNEKVENVMALAFELARIREMHGAQSGAYLSEVRALRAEVTRLAEQGAAPRAVQAGEYPPLPDCDETQCIPYSAIRYVSGYTQEYVHAFAKAAIDADRAARVSPAEKTARMLTEEEMREDTEDWWKHSMSSGEAQIKGFVKRNAGCRIPESGKLEGGA